MLSMSAGPPSELLCRGFERFLAGSGCRLGLSRPCPCYGVIEASKATSTAKQPVAHARTLCHHVLLLSESLEVCKTHNLIGKRNSSERYITASSRSPFRIAFTSFSYKQTEASLLLPDVAQQVLFLAHPAQSTSVNAQQADGTEVRTTDACGTSPHTQESH
eukprot:760578-Hanusia_phi.AAC.2